VPALLTSDIASSALFAITGANDSIGPVNPKIIPILMLSAKDGKIRKVDRIDEMTNFFHKFSSF
jgi:hypothetical protein